MGEEETQMDKVKAALADTGMNLKEKLWNFRCLAMLLILVCMLDMYISTVRTAAGAAGGKINVSILPFVWDDFYGSKVLFLLVLFFYSNVPFIEKNQLYIVARVGRERWGRRNVVYIVFSSLILNLVMVLISILLMLPAGDFSSQWTSASRMAALTSAGEGLSVSMDYGVMKSFLPWEFMLDSFLASWMVTMAAAMLMYTVSLWGNRILAYGITAALLFLPQFTSQVLIMFGSFPNVVWFSPADWVRCSQWRSRAKEAGPDMAYIVVACLMLMAVMYLAGNFRINRMDWDTGEEE